jgi:oligosaccharide reducing-end xylanase
MKRKMSLLIFTCLILSTINLYSQNHEKKYTKTLNSGSYYTGIYRNLFSELLNKTEAEISARLDTIFKKYFYGDEKSQRLYFPVGKDMAYIEDILHNDVRTEGVSYGMMIAVQMDKKNEFDRIWKWAKTYMQHQTRQRKSYFAWQCRTDGSIIDSNSASDGEEWFIMSLFFASARWGNGTGIYNYKAEAQSILDNMINKESGRKDSIKNMFNLKEKQVVFVPVQTAFWFTDPSYHLPHYYELWSRWADKNNDFWCSAAKASRKFFKKAANPITGLMPDYANFDGSPVNPWNGGSNNFQYDAWRVIANIAVDYSWFTSDNWEEKECDKLLDFFYSQGIGKYGTLFTPDGKLVSDVHSTGLVAMNAVGCLASKNKNCKEFVEELWNTPLPEGTYRYYDGMLYMLAMLQVSGNFKIYDPSGKMIIDCMKNN